MPERQQLDRGAMHGEEHAATPFGVAVKMLHPDVTSFTTANVDLLVDFLDGIQVEFGANARRDGIVSFAASGHYILRITVVL